LDITSIQSGKVNKKTRPASASATKMIMSKTHSSNIHGANKNQRGNKNYMNPKGNDHNVISSNDDLKPDTVRLTQKKSNKHSNSNNITDNKSESM